MTYDYLPRATSTDAANDGADVAVLPVGSFEQHGGHLPLVTDTIIATAIARGVSSAYGLRLLPPVAFSCSQEHSAFAGTVSISPTTLVSLIADIRSDLTRQGVPYLILINGHGGNYVLANTAQQANVDRPAVLLFPGSAQWNTAREAAGCTTRAHDDMHAGEAETSILLHVAPDLVGEHRSDADWQASDRPLLHLQGMQAYTPTGVIGRPSEATPEKGRLLLQALTQGLDEPLKLLRGRRPT